MASAPSGYCKTRGCAPRRGAGNPRILPGCDVRVVRQSSGTRDKTHAYDWLISIHASGVRKTAKLQFPAPRRRMPMLTVLNVAYPFAAAGSGAVGGAEQILSILDHVLIARGHESLVIACEGSTAAGRLIKIPAAPDTIDDNARRSAWRLCREVIENTLANYQVDLVHFHGVDFYRYLPETCCRALVTLHPPQIGILQKSSPRARVVPGCTSTSYRPSRKRTSTSMPPEYRLSRTALKYPIRLQRQLGKTSPSRWAASVRRTISMLPWQHPAEPDSRSCSPVACSAMRTTGIISKRRSNPCSVMTAVSSVP
jgi:hypothetical protein